MVGKLIFEIGAVRFIFCGWQVCGRQADFFVVGKSPLFRNYFSSAHKAPFHGESPRLMLLYVCSGERKTSYALSTLLPYQPMPKYSHNKKCTFLFFEFITSKLNSCKKCA